MKLKDYLKLHDLTQMSLARKLGIHKSHIYVIVNERQRPSIDLAREIVKITNGEVTIEDLIKERKKTKKPRKNNSNKHGQTSEGNQLGCS